MKKLTIKKAVLAAALTLTPALALASSAQASPSYRAPAPQRSNVASQWNNPRPAPQQRFEPRREAVRVPDRRNDNRFEPRRDVNRNDWDRNKSKGNDTGKIIGAGIVGAILGAVLSR